MAELITGCCAYCRKIRPLSELKKGRIIYQGFRNGRKQVVEDENLYCNDKPCHGYDQMGHEG
jgi:hypothetical protein